MEKSELFRLIDCCRPGQCDLAEAEMSALMAALEQDPELRAAWESQQAWNAAVGEAIQDVPVPSGLSQRIIANLESSRSANQEVTETRSMDQSGDVSRADARRRWFRAAAVGIAAAAAAVAMAVWLGPWRQSVTGAQVAEMARVWVDDLDVEAWRVKDPPVERYPLDRSLRFPVAQLVQWQTFEALGDTNAVAYRTVMAPDGSAGVLLVIRTRQGRGLPKIPPSMPDSTTQGWCLGVWKDAGLLYVLVVPGTPQQYQRMFSSQSFAASSPVAPQREPNRPAI